MTSRTEMADGLLGQEVAALGAPDALHQPGPPEPKQDLLDVVGGQPLGVGQLTRGDRARSPSGRAGPGGWR